MWLIVLSVAVRGRASSSATAVAGSASVGAEEVSILGHLLDDVLDLVDVVRPGEDAVACGVELADRGEQGSALLFGQGRTERVDGDVDGSAVGFKGEDLVHDLCCWAAEGEGELVKVFEVGFVERVADDLDVELV